MNPQDLATKLRMSDSSLVNRLRGLTNEPVTLPQSQPQSTPANLGMPESDLRTQAQDLLANGKNLATIQKAVDSHPDIVDKEKAKQIVAEEHAKGLINVDKNTPILGGLAREQLTKSLPAQVAGQISAGTNPLEAVKNVGQGVLNEASVAMQTNPKQFWSNAVLGTIGAEGEIGKLGKDLQPLAQEAGLLREAKGLSAENIMAKHPDIQLKRDVPATDIHGNKITIPEGEALTPYELKGNKVLLQDGQTYIVSKNQFQNIKGNAVSGEAKPFAPELKGTEETVKGASKWQGDNLVDNGNTVATLNKNGDGTWSFTSDFSEGSDTFKTRAEAMKEAEMSATGTFSPNETKYSQYQLPGGKNYKEVLIKAPAPKGAVDSSGTVIMGYNKGDVFKSSHWNEPNVISHLRLNERTYQGKKVTFMEELQSDWAREGRSKGFIPENATQGQYDILRKKESDISTQMGEIYKQSGKNSEWKQLEKEFNTIHKQSGDLFKQLNGVPNNPLLKNWQELSVKRGLQEAVNNKSEYFSWINGEQTSARYNLATQVDNVKWNKSQGWETAHKNIAVRAKDMGKSISMSIDKEGKIVSAPADKGLIGKKLDEVLGKGLADKIMEKESGTLSGEGLKFGGEWANNLYDKQVKNIVEDITGGKVQTIDMGLPIENKGPGFWRNNPNGVEGIPLKISDLKVGKEVKRGMGESFIITDILGEKGKFKAVPKMTWDRWSDGFKKLFTEDSTSFPVSRDIEQTFDISTKTTVQQGIRLTPEIRAIVKGEAPVIKKLNNKK